MNKNPNDTAVYGETQFADQTEDEYKEILTLNPELIPEESIDGKLEASSAQQSAFFPNGSSN